MAQDNTGKWKSFQAGLILYAGAGTGQNLNTDLQKAIADEVDSLLKMLVGDGVGSDTFWVVAAGSGLSVNIGPGAGVLQGQILSSPGILAVTGLPASQSGVSIYVTAGTPYNTGLKTWPTVAGFKTTALLASEMLIATINTDGSGVTAITDRRRVLTPISELTTAKVSRARQAASGVL